MAGDRWEDSPCVRMEVTLNVLGGGQAGSRVERVAARTVARHRAPAQPRGRGARPHTGTGVDALPPREISVVFWGVWLGRRRRAGVRMDPTERKAVDFARRSSL